MSSSFTFSGLSSHGAKSRVSAGAVCGTRHQSSGEDAQAAAAGATGGFMNWLVGQAQYLDCLYDECSSGSFVLEQRTILRSSIGFYDEADLRNLIAKVLSTAELLARLGETFQRMTPDARGGTLVRARQGEGARPVGGAEKLLGGHPVLNQADDCRKIAPAIPPPANWPTSAPISTELPA